MSLRCPNCKGKLFRTMSTVKVAMDKAMNTYTRPRHCSCGFKGNTVEMMEEELHELRRKAFLFNLSEARK